MKRLLAVCSVLCALLIVVAAVSAQKGANFAGTWALDKSKSQLQGPMQNVEGITWTVTQDDKEVKREQKIEGAPPAGGPGGGGGGGGRGMMGGGGTLSVKLDGSETTTENPRGKSTTKAKWSGDGKVLEITIVRNVSTPNGDFTLKTTEHWELADDGKTLKVHQSTETPQGAREANMVFTKK